MIDYTGKGFSERPPGQNQWEDAKGSWWFVEPKHGDVQGPNGLLFKLGNWIQWANDPPGINQFKHIKKKTMIIEVDDDVVDIELDERGCIVIDGCKLITLDRERAAELATLLDHFAKTGELL